MKIRKKARIQRREEETARTKTHTFTGWRMPKLGANAPTEEIVTRRAREPKTLLDTIVQSHTVQLRNE
jgi:hypothetical protein